jgi:hypothetical protein
MAKQNSNTRGKAKAGLCALLATLVTGAGCATPLCIKERRMLAQQGKLDNEVYTDVSAADRDYAVNVGIRVNFDSFKDLREGAASAGTAFGYGIVRPLYSEFWHPTDTNKLEYSGLTPVTSYGYINGRKAETAGEWARYLAIIGGVAKGMQKKGGGGSDTPSGTTTTTTTTTTTPTTTIPVTTTTIPGGSGGN